MSKGKWIMYEISEIFEFNDQFKKRGVTENVLENG